MSKSKLGGLVCPNKSLPEWKQLVENVGEDEAYWIWNNTQGDTDTLRPYLRSPEKIVRKVDDFLKELGFETKPVQSIFTNKGVAAVAQVDMLHKIVRVVEGKADDSTLPEEAGSIAIELLKQKNSPLYFNMFREVYNTPEFKQVKQDYQDVYHDDLQLSEEAMSKIIAKKFIQKVEKPTLFEKMWWSNAKKALLGYFNITSEQTKDYFDDVVDWMKSGELGIFQPVNQQFYQLKTQAEQQFEADTKRFVKQETKKGDKKSERYFEKTSDGLREVKNRVSDFVDAYKKKRNLRERTSEEKILDDIKKNTGIKYHAFMEASARELIDETNTIRQPLEYKKDGTKEEKRLYNYLVDQLRTYPEGTKLFPEQIIHNPVEDTAATIDLLVMEPNGKTHILDYKFVSLRSDGKGGLMETDASTREAWNLQLSRYRSILSAHYGIKDFGQTRMIPVSVTYNEDGQPTDYEIGNVSLKNEKKAYLDPVPSWEERTDNKQINMMIDQIQDMINQLRDTTPRNEEEKTRKKARTRQLDKALRELQLRKQTTGLEAFAQAEFKFIEENLLSKPVREIGNDQLLWSMNTMEYLADVKVAPGVHTKARENYEKLGLLFEEWQKARNVENSGDKKLFNLTALDWLTPIHQIRNRVFERFAQLKESVYDNAQNKVDAFNTKIKGILTKMVETGVDPYDLLLEKDKDGKPTGNMVAKYKSEFWEKYADKSKNYQIKDTVDVLEEDGTYKTQKAKTWYKNKLEQEEKIWKEQYLNDQGVVDQDRVDKARADFQYKYDVWNENDKIQNSALKNRFNPLSEPKDEFLSDNYKKLAQSPLHLELYNEFQHITKLANKWAGAKLYTTFVPSMEKGLVRKIISGGVNLGNIGDNIKDSLTFKEWERKEDAKGNPILKIPLKFTSDLRAEKSLELGLVFSQFAQSVYMNKYLQDIEDESYLLLRTLQEGQYYNTDARNRVKPGYAKANNDTVELFRRFQQTYIYGKHNFNKDVEIAGLSVTKMREGLQSVFSKTALGLNLFSAIGNLGGGIANAMMIRIGGSKYFHSTDFGSSMMSLSARNEKAKNIVENLKVRSDYSNYKWGKEHLSLDTLTKVSTDSVYVLQNVGEYLVQNGVMLAMMKNYTVKDGKLIKKEGDEKSLYDLADDSGVLKGNDNLPLPEDLVNEFKRKVRGVNIKIMGSISERDVIQIQQTVLGSMFFQFKRWVLPMGAARFASLKHDGLTGEWEEGRFRSAMKLFATEKPLKLATELLSIFSPGSNALDARIQEMWSRAKDKNPELSDQLDFEQFKRLTLENIRGSIGELAIYALIMATYFGVKPDDDDEDVSTEHTFVTSVLLRISRELSYWVSLDSLDTKATIPLISAIMQFISATKDGLKLMYYNASDDEDSAEKINPGKKFINFVPIVNSYARLMRELGYDKEDQ